MNTDQPAWFRPLLAAGTLLVITGCNQSDFALTPVSGVVTLDGEPLPEARVLFMPSAKADSVRSGPNSTGVTDGEGRFVLKTLEGEVGAVIGSHRVRVSTYRDELAGRGDKVTVLAEERVPARYNMRTELTCDVPGEGLTDYTLRLESELEAEPGRRGSKRKPFGRRGPGGKRGMRPPRGNL